MPFSILGPAHCTPCRQALSLPSLLAPTARPFAPDLFTRGDGLSFWFERVGANYFASHRHPQRQVAIGYGVKGGDLEWREKGAKPTMRPISGDVVWFVGENVEHAVRLRHAAFWIVFYLDSRLDIGRDVAVTTSAAPLRDYIRRDSLIGELGAALRREHGDRRIERPGHIVNLGSLLGSCLLRAHVRGFDSTTRSLGLPDEVVERVRAYVISHLRAPLTVPVLAKVAGMSPDHFTRRLKVSTGLTAEQFVRRIRLAEAQASLRSGKLSVEAVAEACGFGSHAAMTRQFTLRYGRPPRSYLPAGACF